MVEYQGSISHTIRENDEKRAQERKRFLLYLISAYLRDCHLHNVADTLWTDAQLTTAYEVCDNVDLDTILQEYQSYYYAKFNKFPKICKRSSINANTASTNHSSCAGDRKKKVNVTSLPRPSAGCRASQTAAPLFDFNIDVTKLGPRTNKEDDAERNQRTGLLNLAAAGAAGEDVVLTRPLCDFKGYSPEWNEMAQHIVNTALVSVINLTARTGWNDCVGLDETVELLKESVIYPLQYPHVFTGLISPWKGILLYGPPGTGKTLLARALAFESRITFLNVTSSGFISKWRGDSEKLIKVLFDVAKFYAPSIIFIDELDAMASRRDDSHHDAPRRFKSELLTQLDGLLTEDEKIFVLASTNLPWDLDPAILRRFEKRILVDIPGRTARADIFRYYFRNYNMTFQDCQRLAEMTQNYSGSDIKLICKEACMSVVRQQFPKIRNSPANKELDFLAPTFDDARCAAEKVKPAASTSFQDRYVEWGNNYGCK